MPPVPREERSWLPARGRRLLVFSDSRREAARLGPTLTRQHEIQLGRALIIELLREWRQPIRRYADLLKRDIDQITARASWRSGPTNTWRASSRTSRPAWPTCTPGCRSLGGKNDWNALSGCPSSLTANRQAPIKPGPGADSLTWGKESGECQIALSAASSVGIRKPRLGAGVT